MPIEEQASPTAGEKAATLETAGIREAAVLETAGVRDADVLRTAGARDADALKTAGQRRINLIWEITQAIVAVSVAIGTMIICGSLILDKNKESDTAFLLLSNAFFMIITAYFQRTNHTRTGGITGKDER